MSPIVDGKYEIPAQYGVRPAAYVMHVTGYFKNESTEGGQVDGQYKELFPLFTKDLTFSAGNTTLNIEVPEPAK